MHPEASVTSPETNCKLVEKLDEVVEGCDEIDEEDAALCSMALPMALMVPTVSWARPPKVSATSYRHKINSC